MRTLPETKIEDIVVGGHQRPSLALCIPSVGLCTFKFTIAFSRLQMPTNGAVQFYGTEGLEVGVARCELVRQALNGNPVPKYLFFLGDDMLAPWDGLVTLYEEMERGGWDVLSALYYLKAEPPVPLMWRNDKVGRMKAGEHFQVGDVCWVDLTGLDFTLIRSDLFAKLQKPYFKTGPTGGPNGAVWAHTEDAWFMKQIKQVNGRIGVHTAVRVAHYDYKTGMIY